jgi:hypothetical protein
MLAAPAVVGAVVLLAVARRGVYVSPDGVDYLGTARNLVHGRGLRPPPGSPPPANFPPLFPLVLAAGALLGPDPLDVAAVVNPLLFGATILVVTLALRRLTGSTALATAGGVVTLVAADLLAYHTAALSEPLFVFSAVLALVVLARAIETRRLELLLGAAGLAGAAALTRYVGVAVVAAGAAGLIWAGRGRRGHGVVDAGSYLVVGLLPLAGWLLAVPALGTGGGHRHPALHPFGWRYLLGGLRAASRWVLPGAVAPGPRLAALAVVASALAAAAVTTRDRHRTRPLPVLVGLFAGFYLVALLVDRLLFDVTGRLDNRFLVPLHVAAVVLAVDVVARLPASGRRVAAGAAAVLVLPQLAAAISWLDRAPGGYAGPLWRRSAVMADVASLPHGVPVFTNAPDAVYFLTGRTARRIPEEAEFLSGRRRAAFGQELAAMAGELRAADGRLAWFRAAPARRVFLPSEGELAHRLGLRPLRRDAVGTLYRVG